jgi:hypothetical protein
MAGFLGWIALAGTLAGAAESNHQEGEKTGGGTNIERFMMEGTEIPGSLEEPHVVYVVPWKEVPSLTQGDISIRRSFKEEILEPVDRDRFQRQLRRAPRDLKGGNSK